MAGRFAGSIFVNIRARKVLQKLLRNSQYDNPDILDELIGDHFETSTKRQFKDASKASWLRVANRDETSAILGIRQGRLRIDGKDMADCFDHSVSEALKSIRDQIARSGRLMPVWLVGGFAASDYLFRKLEEVLKCDGVDVRRSSSIDLAKAEAHGNVLYSIGDTVSSRVTRHTYGTRIGIPYDESNAEHRRRKHLRYTNLSGEVRIPGRFDVIVKRDCKVNETDRFSRPYVREVQYTTHASFEENLLCYKHGDPVPEWLDENKGLFDLTCIIKADLSKLCHPSSIRVYNDKVFWRLEYEVEITFGLTELQARIKWIENGETKYGPATIFYEE